MRWPSPTPFRDAKLKYAIFARVATTSTDRRSRALYCTGAHGAKSARQFASVEEPPQHHGHRKKLASTRPVNHVLGGSASRRCEASAPIKLHLKSLIETSQGGTVEEIIIPLPNPKCRRRSHGNVSLEASSSLSAARHAIGVAFRSGSDLEIRPDASP